MSEDLAAAVEALAAIREADKVPSLDDLKHVPVYLWPAIDRARNLPPAEAVAVLAEAKPPYVAPATEPLTDPDPETVETDRLLDALLGRRPGDST